MGNQLKLKPVTRLMDGGVRALAPAKINLNLHITGRREDGYHLLESVFAFANIGDVVEARDGQGLHLDIAGPEASSLKGSECAEDNLVLKAAKALQDYCGIQSGARIRLLKYLPVSSGIGGGSADAAATLLALINLWQLELKTRDLQQIAVGLGADVFACLFGGPLWVTGIGETIRPARLDRQYHAVLANPRKSISTPKVFSLFKEQACVFDQWVQIPNRIDLNWLEKTSNRLQTLTVEVLLEVGKLLQFMEAAKGCKLARMSGSGATCFALFEDITLANQLQEKLRQNYPNWWSVCAVI